jgi:hypothetical protein
MISKYFDQYSQLHQLGRRTEAAAAIRSFVESFSSTDEKRSWSETYLAAHPKGHRIRHELYEQVIFPALLEGYRRSDPWSLRCLANTCENLYSCRRLWQEVECKGEIQFLENLLELCPNDEDARAQLLSCYVDQLRYAAHEWPAGILYGCDGATLEECKEIRAELERARGLDRRDLYGDFLADFDRKLQEYTKRLTVLRDGASS